MSGGDEEQLADCALVEFVRNMCNSAHMRTLVRNSKSLTMEGKVRRNYAPPC